MLFRSDHLIGVGAQNWLTLPLAVNSIVMSGQFLTNDATVRMDRIGLDQSVDNDTSVSQDLDVDQDMDRCGPGSEGAARGVHGGEAIVAAVSSLSPQEEDPGRWVPLSGSSFFSFFLLFPVAFRELIRALKPFEKFWKNSQGLETWLLLKN